MKKYSFIIVTLLMLIMTSGINIMAATPTQTSYSFTLAPGGDVYRSGDAKKKNYNSYAILHFTEYSNRSSYPLIARVRSATNDTYASDTVKINSTGYFYPTYFSGYGQFDYNYYFKIQTDSYSAYSATGRGFFYA